MFSPYPMWHKVWSALAEYFWSLERGRIWCYNILGNNKGSISCILWIDHISAGSILLTIKLVAPERENTESIVNIKSCYWIIWYVVAICSFFPSWIYAFYAKSWYLYANVSVLPSKLSLFVLWSSLILSNGLVPLRIILSVCWEGGGQRASGSGKCWVL